MIRETAIDGPKSTIVESSCSPQLVNFAVGCFECTPHEINFQVREIVDAPATIVESSRRPLASRARG